MTEIPEWLFVVLIMLSAFGFISIGLIIMSIKTKPPRFRKLS